MMKLNNLLEFLKFTQQFNSIKRSIYAIGEDRMENDVEHSYQLAMAVWYVIENENLKLNSNLAIKYSLIHDLEEAIMGDIHIFDTKGRKEKEEKEKVAREKLVNLFPNWKEYKELSKSYKELKDEEGKLVNGMDKILPVINIYLDSGRTWQKEGRKLSEIIDNKRSTTVVHPLTKNLWKEMEKLLLSKESELFKNEK